MTLSWLGDTEDFYSNLFAYLKRKFPHRFKAFQLIGQNATDVSIYHETIVALEQVHQVLIILLLLRMRSLSIHRV